MIAALTNHLWQSTLFVLAAWIVAMALHKNGAHIRHRVWVVASLKFLVPFSLLMSLGSALPAISPAAEIAAPAAPALAVAVDSLAQPFTSEVFFPSPAATTTTQATTNWGLLAIAGGWACGFVAIACTRLRGWRRIRAAMHTAAPVHMASPVPVRSSPDLLEPGVVGLWRPVLLVPAGIEQHLTQPQLEAVLAHELCHVQRRDNLTSAIHMVVEAVFWFHPLVWFVGARLVEERERACDEHVLRVCGEPRTYAESILNVCKLYVESPIACVSGVTGHASPKWFFRGGGADLKKRIAAIISNRVGLQLNFARKVALILAATFAVILPLVIGVMVAPVRASAFAAAQTVAATAGPRFEVVSIKPCREDQPPRGRGASPWMAQTSPEYVHWDCVTLGDLISLAYANRDTPLLNNLELMEHLEKVARGESPTRVRGGPSWVYSDKFTIEAKGSGAATDPALGGNPMTNLAKLPPAMSVAVRAFLEDRFQLKVRRATEQQPMYGLTVARTGLKITPVPPVKCWERSYRSQTPPPGFEGAPTCSHTMSGHGGGGNETRNFRNYSMKNLADHLSRTMDRYVLDQTGIEGRFNFGIVYAPDDNTPGDRPDPVQLARDRASLGLRPEAPEAPVHGDGPTIFKALEALGLKLESIKGPAEYLLIDSVQKPRPDSPAFGAASAGKPASSPPARAKGAGR